MEAVPMIFTIETDFGPVRVPDEIPDSMFSIRHFWRYNEHDGTPYSVQYKVPDNPALLDYEGYVCKLAAEAWEAGKDMADVQPVEFRAWMRDWVARETN